MILLLLQSLKRKKDSLSASAILGSYPNPFNTWTKISLFVHERDARAIKLLKIYNLLGQLVAVVDVSHLPAGMHEMPLEVGGILEGSLASGLYIVRLQVQNTIISAVRINLVR